MNKIDSRFLFIYSFPVMRTIFDAAPSPKNLNFDVENEKQSSTSCKLWTNCQGFFRPGIKNIASDIRVRS